MRLCKPRRVDAARLGPAYPRGRISYLLAGAPVKAVHAVVGFATIGLSAGAFAIGAWCYWRVRDTPWFWRALRTSQGAVVVSVALGGMDRLVGHKVSGLHVLYGVLPILVSFIAEQLRVASAQTVLDARGFASAQ